MLARVKDYYHNHERACTAGLFVAGFLFDTLAVGRIDAPHNIIHQACYLSLCAWLTGLEIRERQGAFSPPERFKTAWRYHEGATHFMLGTLINIYTLFYFKSASLLASLVFMLFWCALLGVNELRLFPGSGTTLRMTLAALCLVSYFGYLIPMLAGGIGPWVFLGSLAAAAAVWAPYVWRLQTYLPDRPQIVWRHALMPFLAVEFVFGLLYFSKLIPPVPLSLSSVGIFHEVRKTGDQYQLTMTRSKWRFWERGDQTFLARKGDKIFCFVSIFSPTRFRERLSVRWLFYEAGEGWKDSDAIPLEVVGGRDGGYRGFTVKTRHKPGRWRVVVETSDGRELGRIGLRVRPDEETGVRESRVLSR